MTYELCGIGIVVPIQWLGGSDLERLGYLSYDMWSELELQIEPPNHMIAVYCYEQSIFGV